MLARSTTFDPASAKDLQPRLKLLIRETQPYAKKIAHHGVWVEPSLAEIEYRAKSAEGKVRHLVFNGIRDDLQSRLFGAGHPNHIKGSPIRAAERWFTADDPKVFRSSMRSSYVAGRAIRQRRL